MPTARWKAIVSDTALPDRLSAQCPNPSTGQKQREPAAEGLFPRCLGSHTRCAREPGSPQPRPSTMTSPPMHRPRPLDTKRPPDAFDFKKPTPTRSGASRPELVLFVTHSSPLRAPKHTTRTSPQHRSHHPFAPLGTAGAKPRRAGTSGSHSPNLVLK